MMTLLSAFALAVLATPSAGPTIEVGKANWNEMPRLAKAERMLPYEELVGRVETILAQKKCQLRGQTARRFDITVPYAVLVGAGGTVQRIVVADLGCEPIESLVGNMVADLSELGDFKNAGAASPRWYASDFNFTLQ
jgi:hypothetical protein